MFIVNGRQDILNHVEKVATIITGIAQDYSLDLGVCLTAAYCHDTANIIQGQDMLNYVRAHEMNLDEAEEKHPFLLHQRFSAMIAKEMFAVTDERILSAVTCHSTLWENPSQYDMALFIADKLSWDQEDSQPFYEAVKSGLNKSLYHGSFAYIEYMLNNNLLLWPHKWLTAAYIWLKKAVLAE